jgi:hypothetical protein
MFLASNSRLPYTCLKCMNGPKTHHSWSLATATVRTVKEGIFWSRHTFKSRKFELGSKKLNSNKQTSGRNQHEHDVKRAGEKHRTYYKRMLDITEMRTCDKWYRSFRPPQLWKTARFAFQGKQTPNQIRRSNTRVIKYQDSTLTLETHHYLPRFIALFLNTRFSG